MKSELKRLLEEAETFHSHLGPFLVLGLKAGLLALHELGSKRGDSKLNAQVELPYRVPISCLLDGVQFSTGCTIGNKRLSFKDSTDLTLTFVKSGDAAELALKEATFKLLRPLFHGEDLNQKKLSDLAHDVATMSEKELFHVKERATASV